MSERPHSNLDVWKKAIKLVISVYKLTTQYPPEEKYGLVSQMRRATVSIPSNIAEGVARKTTKEYIQFLYISRGSLSELDTHLEISQQIGYINSEQYKDMIDEMDEISRMLSGLIKALEKRLGSREKG
ncbi:MAG: four helix bundle protein [Nitrospirota bacterium]